MLAAGGAICHGSTQPELSQKQVLQACRNAADWQLQHPNGRPMGDWVQGPFIHGLFAISKNSESPFDSQKQQSWLKLLADGNYAAIAKAYADYMIEHGRDVYGKVHSPLFMTVLKRKTGKPFKAPYPHVIAKPYAPGLRRDHKMRPYDRTYIGSNPLEDLPLYGLLYYLTPWFPGRSYAEFGIKLKSRHVPDHRPGSAVRAIPG